VTAAGTCPTCGRSLDDHDRHVRFRRPEAALLGPGGLDGPDVWMSDATPEASVLLQTPDAGAFARCLLPVRLTGGHRVTFGVWLAFDPAELGRVVEVWWDDAAYPGLVLDGYLANTPPFVDVLRAPVRAVVRDPGHTPYLDSSPHPGLTRLLTAEWPHDEVLPTLPPAG
jgi:hypothetical protein